jgi:hypothetical protein
MSNITRQDAFLLLWVITWLNIGGGVLVWVFNWFRQIGALSDLEKSSRDAVRTTSENEELLISAEVWMEIASNWIGFGILALVITLAAVAVAGNTNKT